MTSRMPNTTSTQRGALALQHGAVRVAQQLAAQIFQLAVGQPFTPVIGAVDGAHVMTNTHLGFDGASVDVSIYIHPARCKQWTYSRQCMLLW